MKDWCEYGVELEMFWEECDDDEDWEVVNRDEWVESYNDYISSYIY